MSIAPIENIGRVTSKSVRKHTDKEWHQWVQILAKAGADSWVHKDIAEFLVKKYKLSQWWCHIVATGYEVYIGRKIAGRNQKGEYQITVTKSLKVDGKKTWKFVSSPKGIAMWLAPMSKFALKPKSVYEREDGVYGEIRTMKAGHRIRLTWIDGDASEATTVVQVMVVHRAGRESSILCFQHEKLRDGRLKDVLRDHWRGILEAIAAEL